MISRYTINIIVLVCTLLVSFSAEAKKIKVIPSSDNNIVGRSIPSGHTRIAFKTNIKELDIVSLLDDPIANSNSNNYQYYIDIDLDKDAQKGIKPQRIIILKSPNTAEYRLETEELKPGHLYLYQVIIDDFPTKATLMYSHGSSGIIGAQAAFGSRYGVYFRASMPKKREGINIADWTEDVDLTNSQHVAYSHLSTVLGPRFGVLSDPFLLYVEMGFGYGMFYRKWKNTEPLKGSKYYYSDLLKGPEIDIGTSFSYGIIAASVGTSFLFSSKGKNNIAIRFGIGISL